MIIASDGIPEAWSTNDEEFGDERLLQLVNRWRGGDAKDFCNGVLQAVTAFSEDRAQSDDMTLIAATGDRVSARRKLTKS